MNPCPEAAKRAAMTDDQFWEYVLNGLSGDHAGDVDEAEPNEPWDCGLELANPCWECGEIGACAYDSEGRALVHVVLDEEDL